MSLVAVAHSNNNIPANYLRSGSFWYMFRRLVFKNQKDHLNVYDTSTSPTTFFYRWFYFLTEKKMTKISVIIPVYNSEKHLVQCLDSIIGQDFYDIEIICIDDGSKDSSQDILSDYAKKDKRIQIIKQKNQFAGIARNNGLAIAKGDYVHFLDSDDWVNPSIYNDTYKKITHLDVDVCIFEYNSISPSGCCKSNSLYKSINIPQNCTFSFSDFEQALIYSDVVPWNKLYKRSFLIENNIKFDDIQCAHDRLFYFHLLSKNPQICYINKAMINYRLGTNESLSLKDDFQGYSCHLKSMDKICKIFPDNEMILDITMLDILNLYNKSRSINKEKKELIAASFNKIKLLKTYTPPLWLSFYKRITNTLNVIPIVFATNENYLPYLAVTLQSLIDNGNNETFYDIYIFYDRISDNEKNKILNMVAELANVGIEFVNINSYIKNAELYSSAHFSKEMYYRILIPEILAQYSKVLYLDCDIAIVDNISELYNINIQGNMIAAVINHTKNMEKYVKNVLGVNPYEYINSGVILFNTDKCLQNNLKEKCLNLLKTLPKLNCPDQDIINIACKDNILFLDGKWNFYWHHTIPQEYLTEWDKLEERQKKEYIKSWKNPAIIHYTTGLKPWNSPSFELSKIWWQYARKTPFYEEILYKNMIQININNDIFKLPKLRLKRLRYKIMSKITFGKTRKKYKEKAKKLKIRIKKAQEFIGK